MRDVGREALDEIVSDLPVGPELNGFGNVGLLATGTISSPVFGQIQIRIEQSEAARGRIGQIDPDLAIVDLAESRAIEFSIAGSYRSLTAFSTKTDGCHW